VISLRKLIEMPIEEGSSVWVAVDIPDEQADDEVEKVGVREFLFGAPEKVEQNFGIVRDMILKCSRPIIESFEYLAKEKIQPKTATAEFGLSFTGKGNVYLVETSVEGSIKISLEWDLGVGSQKT
jgi:hypothetical protein